MGDNGRLGGKGNEAFQAFAGNPHWSRNEPIRSCYHFHTMKGGTPVGLSPSSLPGTRRSALAVELTVVDDTALARFAPDAGMRALVRSKVSFPARHQVGRQRRLGVGIPIRIGRLGLVRDGMTHTVSTAWVLPLSMAAGTMRPSLVCPVDPGPTVHRLVETLCGRSFRDACCDRYTDPGLRFAMRIQAYTARLLRVGPRPPAREAVCLRRRASCCPQAIRSENHRGAHRLVRRRWQQIAFPARYIANAGGCRPHAEKVSRDRWRRRQLPVVSLSKRPAVVR